jgi:hypothetical protein
LLTSQKKKREKESKPHKIQYLCGQRVFLATMATSVSSVPAKFLAAKDAIRKHRGPGQFVFLKPFHSCCQRNSTESTFEAVTEGWTKAEKKSFIEWLCIQLKTEREEEIRQQQA